MAPGATAEAGPAEVTRDKDGSCLVLSFYVRASDFVE